MPIHKTLNKDFFKTWSPEMAYVLGFFAADGNMVRSKRGGYYISFEITDLDLLEKIKALLQSTHKITVRQRTPRCKLIYRLQIGSKIMFEDLVRLGFIPNKTKVLLLPNIPEIFFSHFVRGYFDGDGNVWSGKIHKFDRPHSSDALSVCFTSGSDKFLAALKENLKISADTVGGSLYYHRAFRLQYASVDSLKLYRFMYYHSGDLCLSRKKQVFERFLNMRA